MNTLSAAEEGRSTPRSGRAVRKEHRYGNRQINAYQIRKANREAAKKVKAENRLPRALHGKTLAETERRLSIKNEAVAAGAEFCGTFCKPHPVVLSMPFK